MKDKKKLFVRILCGILVFIMTMGLIIPYVAASEIEGVAGEQVEEIVTTEQITDGFGFGWGAELEFEASDFPIPFEEVSDGFEYTVFEDGAPLLIKEDNGNTGFWISGLPENYDCGAVTLFVGNLETEEVVTINLTADNYYLGQLDLWDGYYVIFPNGYSFCDSNGVGYAINGGKNLYFHIGHGFDEEKYPVEFMTVFDNTELFKLSLSEAPDDFQKVSSTTTLDIDASKIEFPNDVRVDVLGIKDEPIVEDEKTEQQTIPSEEMHDQTVATEDETEDKNDKYTWYGILLNGLKKNIILITALVACYVGTIVVKIKKKKELEKQAENDKYDDGLIE